MSAGQNYSAVSPLLFNTGGTPIEQYVFVTTTPTTLVAAIGATEAMNGITTQPSDDNENIVSVVSVKDVTVVPFVKAGEDITLGDELASDASGYAIVATGATGIFARKTVKTGGLVPVSAY